MKYDELLSKRRFYDEFKYNSFLHSSRLEGFAIKDETPDPRTLSKAERQQLLESILNECRQAGTA